MMFVFRAFLVVILFEGRISHHNQPGSLQEGPARVRSFFLNHSGLCGCEFTGIQASIGKQLSGGFKSCVISNFREDDTASRWEMPGMLSKKESSSSTSFLSF